MSFEQREERDYRWTRRAVILGVVWVVVGLGVLLAVGVSEARGPILTAHQARAKIKADHPQNALRWCRRDADRRFICRVVITFGWVEVVVEDENGNERVTSRRAIRTPVWAAVGLRGVKWSLYREDL